MKSVLLLLCVVGLVVACARRAYVPVKETRTVRTTVVDTVVSVKLEQVRDTVVMPARDTMSRLRNRYAESYARIEDGYLGHSLSVVAGAEASGVVQKVVVHVRDSVPYAVEVVERVEVVPGWAVVLMVVLGVLVVVLICVRC